MRSTCVTKVGCPFWTCRMLPLNSRIGSVTWMRCHKIIHITFQCERNYVVLAISQIRVLRVRPGKLVLCDSIFICQENECVWISIYLMTAVWKNHKTCKYEYIFCIFYCKSNFTIIWSWKRERVRANLKQLEA